jgi:uncharacterized protein YjdB
MKKRFCFVGLSIFLAAALFAACGKKDDGGTGLEPPGTEETISLSETSLELFVGQSFALTANVSPGGLSVEWTVSDPAVLSAEGGTVIGLGPGAAIVTASAGDYVKAVCTVRVTQNLDPAYSVAIDREYTQLAAGQELTLRAAVRLGSAAVPGAEAVWSVAEGTAVTVDAAGRVTAVSAGAATVRAAYAPEGKPTVWAECLITVI